MVCFVEGAGSVGMDSLRVQRMRMEGLRRGLFHTSENIWQTLLIGFSLFQVGAERKYYQHLMGRARDPARFPSEGDFSGSKNQ